MIIKGVHSIDWGRIGCTGLLNCLRESPPDIKSIDILRDSSKSAQVVGPRLSITIRKYHGGIQKKTVRSAGIEDNGGGIKIRRDHTTQIII